MNFNHQQQDLVLRAASGDRNAFEKLMLEHRDKLRSVVRSMVGHPEDTEDLVQESMIQAWQDSGTLRGETDFSTWLRAIGMRLSLDFLHQQKRWRTEAQIEYGNECYNSEELQAELEAVITDPDFVYEVEEHIAYCFTCVGRSLPPDEYAALIMCDVSGLTSQEAANALAVTDTVLREQLVAARNQMAKSFDVLCSLASNQGICSQCTGLRDATPAAHQGNDIPGVYSLDDRLQVVRRANIVDGASQAMHDLLWKRIKQIEELGMGRTNPVADNGQQGPPD